MDNKQIIFAGILIIHFLWCSVDCAPGTLCAEYLDAEQCGQFFRNHFIANTSYESKDKAAVFCAKYGLELKSSISTNLFTFKKTVTAFWISGGEARYNQNGAKISGSSNEPVFPVCYANIFSCARAFKDHEICARNTFCLNDRCFFNSNKRMSRQDAEEYCADSQLAEIKVTSVFQELSKLINNAYFWLRPIRNGTEPFRWSDDDNVTDVADEGKDDRPNLGLDITSEYHQLVAHIVTDTNLALCEGGAIINCKTSFHILEVCTTQIMCAYDRCFHFSTNEMNRQSAEAFCKNSRVAEIKSGNHLVYQELRKLIRNAKFWLRPTRIGTELFKWSDNDNVTSVDDVTESNRPNLRVEFESFEHRFTATRNTDRALALCEEVETEAVFTGVENSNDKSKIGLGVGLTVLIIAIIAGAVFIFRWRNRNLVDPNTDLGRDQTQSEQINATNAAPRYMCPLPATPVIEAGEDTYAEIQDHILKVGSIKSLKSIDEPILDEGGTYVDATSTVKKDPEYLHLP